VAAFALLAVSVIKTAVIMYMLDFGNTPIIHLAADYAMRQTVAVEIFPMFKINSMFWNYIQRIFILSFHCNRHHQL